MKRDERRKPVEMAPHDFVQMVNGLDKANEGIRSSLKALCESEKADTQFYKDLLKILTDVDKLTADLMPTVHL